MVFCISRLEIKKHHNSESIQQKRLLMLSSGRTGIDSARLTRAKGDGAARLPAVLCASTTETTKLLALRPARWPFLFATVLDLCCKLLPQVLADPRCFPHP